MGTFLKGRQYRLKDKYKKTSSYIDNIRPAVSDVDVPEEMFNQYEEVKIVVTEKEME